MKRHSFGKKNILLALAAIVLLVPKTQEGLILVVAGTLSSLSGASWLQDILGFLPFSPTHADLFLKTLATSSPLSRFVSQSLALAVAGAIGTIVVVKGKGGSVLLTCLGVLLTVQVLVNFLGQDLSQGVLEDMGINFIIGPMFEGKSNLYNLSMIFIVPWMLRLAFISVSFSPFLTSKCTLKVKATFLAIALICAFFIPPLQTKAENPVIAKPVVEQKVQKEEATPTETVQTAMPASPTPFPTRALQNEKPQIVRAVHYYFGNVLKMTPQEREKVLRTDLAIISQVGFNTITGWEEEGFDEKFLELAREYNLWVIKPLNLSLVDGNFLDEKFRKETKEKIAQKIVREQSSQALLAWNIGADEPLEQMSSHYKRQAEQVQAAADLIVELAVLTHELDPQHFVITSEPQDWYIKEYQSALSKARKSGKDPKSFFVFGANFYAASTLKTDLLRTKKAVSEKLDVPFAVMEWAPFGVDKVDRPFFRAKMAKEVAEATQISAVYVFNPAIDILNDMPDPTLAIVTGLSLTNMERDDRNGLMASLAGTLGHPLFPVALDILNKDRESGYFGVPISEPIQLPNGDIVQYFSRKEIGSKNIYRWVLKEKMGVIRGPETVE